jgi:hypothetical protein
MPVSLPAIPSSSPSGSCSRLSGLLTISPLAGMTNLPPPHQSSVVVSPTDILSGPSGLTRTEITYIFVIRLNYRRITYYPTECIKEIKWDGYYCYSIRIPNTGNDNGDKCLGKELYTTDYLLHCQEYRCAAVIGGYRADIPYCHTSNYRSRPHVLPLPANATPPLHSHDGHSTGSIGRRLDF